MQPADSLLEAAPAASDEEQLVLVDSFNRPTGAAGKLAVHRDGLRHRAFSIFLVDRAGRVLLQQRSRAKYHSSGLWANACCGHPRPGEPTAAAARRRLYEELGVRSALRFGFRTAYAARLANGLIENEIVSVYFGRASGPIRPDPDEVAQTRWMGLAALEADIRRRPQDYACWLQHYVARHGAQLVRLAARIGRAGAYGTNGHA